MSRTIGECVFCGTRGPFARREYGEHPSPHGWPASHCFQGKTIAVCEHCRGGFVHEVMSEEDVSAFYAAIYRARSDIESTRTTDFHELTPRFFSQMLYLKSFLDLRDGMRVLEFGPNVVSALPALSLFCKPRYYYFDQVESPIIAHYGGRRIGPYASGAEIVRHLGQAGLDLVYASHSLEHVNPGSLDELLGGISRAITPGGHLFFEVPDDLAIDMLWVPHTLFFSEPAIRNLLGRHGFELVTLGRWGSPVSPRPNGAHQTDRKGNGAASPSRLRDAMLDMPPLARLLRPLRLQRGVVLALKRLRTPYESTPYFRVVARKAGTGTPQ